MRFHVVQQGECLTRIAERYGFSDYKALYDHPDNAELKKKRPNPNVLWPGDRIAVPDRDEKDVECAAGKKHTFKVKVPKKTLRLRLVSIDDEPLANADYELDLEGTLQSGTTDGDGRVEEKVPADALTGTLTVGDYVVELKFGHLNPLAERDENDGSGIQARLRNLGYDVGPVDGKLGHRTRAALALFQSDQGLDVDGEPSEDTLSKLEKAHGC